MSSSFVFFGTPAFAVATLDALERAGRLPYKVVTQPARPVGRGRRVQDPPVAEWAHERGIPVEQPRRVRARSFLDRLQGESPDLAVVVAFGQIFPQRLLEIPLLGCVNVHASLLPAYRGAAPIQAAIANGESETGVTTMQMERGLDTGPILLQRSLEIGADEVSPQLSERLSQLGGELMVETFERLERGDLEATPQDGELATLAPMLSKEDGRINWRRSARETYDRLRAYTPWPGTSTTLRGEVVKVGGGSVLEGSVPDGAVPGSYLGLRDERLTVACGDDSLFGIEVLQRPGRKALPAPAFANGERLEPGESFGRESAD